MFFTNYKFWFLLWHMYRTIGISIVLIVSGILTINTAAQGGGSRTLQPGDYCRAFPLDPQCNSNPIPSEEINEPVAEEPDTQPVPELEEGVEIDAEVIEPEETLVEELTPVSEEEMEVEENEVGAAEQGEEQIEEVAQILSDAEAASYSVWQKIVRWLLISLITFFGLATLIAFLVGYSHKKVIGYQGKTVVVDIIRLPLILAICAMVSLILFILTSMVF